jgi:membrane fusion protein (multidrug efflux system)
MFRILLITLVLVWPAFVFSSQHSSNVKVVVASYADLYDMYEAVGECSSLAGRDFVAARSGTITAINTSQGSSVKAGDVILKINGPLVEAQYKAADLSLKRDLALFDKRVISEEALEKSKIYFEQSKSEYNDMVITAPFDGSVGVIKKRVGDTVVVGDYLFSVTSGSDKEIIVHLPAKLLPVVNLETMLEVGGKDSPNLPGKISAISPYLIKTSGNFLVKIIQEGQNRLLHGSFVKVKFFLNPHNAIVVPERAIMKNDKGSFVFVVDDSMKARRNYVTTGSRLNNQIEVSGINPGDKVIVEGLTKLTDGAEVTITDE